MDWRTVLISFIASALTVLLSKVLDRSIEGQKARQSKELLESQNAFSAGATSHMAAVAYDKHVAFCEEYVEEIYGALDTLIPDGAGEPLDARRFSRIRQKWALWLTPDIESKLDQFEFAITQMVGGPARDEPGSGGQIE